MKHVYSEMSFYGLAPADVVPCKHYADCRAPRLKTTLVFEQDGLPFVAVIGVAHDDYEE